MQFLKHPILAISRGLLYCSHNRALAQLAATRENLSEAEEDYSHNYPTDDLVERIVGLREEEAELEEELRLIGQKEAKLDALLHLRS